MDGGAAEPDVVRLVAIFPSWSGQAILQDNGCACRRAAATVAVLQAQGSYGEGCAFSGPADGAPPTRILPGRARAVSIVSAIPPSTKIVAKPAQRTSPEAGGNHNLAISLISLTGTSHTYRQPNRHLVPIPREALDAVMK